MTAQEIIMLLPFGLVLFFVLRRVVLAPLWSLLVDAVGGARRWYVGWRARRRLLFAAGPAGAVAAAPPPSAPAAPVAQPAPLPSSPPANIAPPQLVSMQAVAKLLAKVPHAAIIGDTGAGKTTFGLAFLRLLAEQLGAAGQQARIPILDIKASPGKWGLPAVGCDSEGGYGRIAATLDQLWLVEWRERVLAVSQGRPAGPPLYVVWDEINDSMEETKEKGATLKDAGKRLRRWLRLGREYGVHLIIFPQSDRVGALGLDGHGDAKKNILWIYLGNDARAMIRKLVDEQTISAAAGAALLQLERPALLDYQGKWYPIDVTPALAIAARPIDPAFGWSLPAPETPAEQALRAGAPLRFEDDVPAQAAPPPSPAAQAAPLAAVWTEEHVRVAAWVAVEPKISNREIARRLWPDKDSGGANAIKAGKLKDAVRLLAVSPVSPVESGEIERETAAEQPVLTANIEQKAVAA